MRSLPRAQIYVIPTFISLTRAKIYSLHPEIQSCRLDVARKIYANALRKSESYYARNFLLCALLEQRCGNIKRGIICELLDIIRRQDDTDLKVPRF